MNRSRRDAASGVPDEVRTGRVGSSGPLPRGLACATFVVRRDPTGELDPVGCGALVPPGL